MLGGPTSEGRASYQVAVTRCPDCKRMHVDAGAESIEVDAAFAEMVECDCQDIGSVDCEGSDDEACDDERCGSESRADSELRTVPGTEETENQAVSPRVGAASADAQECPQVGGMHPSGFWPSAESTMRQRTSARSS